MDDRNATISSPPDLLVGMAGRHGLMNEFGLFGLSGFACGVQDSLWAVVHAKPVAESVWGCDPDS